jgi:acetyltransferase-like isoleucine patch superfamily enzyme
VAPIARIRRELENLDVRFAVFHLLMSWLPPLAFNGVRTRLLRMGGVRIGRGTSIGGAFHVHGGGRPAHKISIGDECWINDSCTFDASAPITVGHRVAIAQGVMILTNTHERGPSHSRAGTVVGYPVRIEDGVWIGARSTILPGVTVRRGAIVAAGAVVADDVSPDTLVGGVPARLIRQLDG